MSNLIPCPINEKDLCSDVLFDCLFDNDIYCEGERNTLVGFLNGGVTTAKYTEGSNVATLRFLERPINELDKERDVGRHLRLQAGEKRLLRKGLS